MKKLNKKNKPFVQAVNGNSVKSEKPQSKSNKITYLIITILAIVAVVLFQRISNERNINNFKSKVIPDAVKKLINDPSTTKIKIEKVKDTNGIYEFEMVLTANGNNQKYTSYITKDGKIIFTSGIKLDTLNQKNTPAATGEQKKLTCKDLEKVETPKLTAFVVADCPYGLQMQRVMKKSLDELPDLSLTTEVRYIGAVENNKITSMHGDKEAQENLRQICLREEQKNKYWPYVSCYMQAGKSDECLTSSGVDTTALKTCMEDNNKGLKYAQVDFSLASKLGVSGSPTLILNDKQTVSEFDFGGRVPNALKEMVCCSSKTQPEYCKNEISKDAVASSFSETDAAAEGSDANAAAGCGN